MQMDFLADGAADATEGSGSASQPMQPFAQSNQPASAFAGECSPNIHLVVALMLQTRFMLLCRPYPACQ